MKKALFIMLLALLCVSFVFAEGAREQKSQADGPVKITMWYNATQTEVGPLPNDWPGYQILKDKLNIDLEAYSLPSSSVDQAMKIQAAAAADELPDFVTIESREVFLKLVENGLLADVTDYYKLMPERNKVMFDEDSVNYTKVDGRSYGFAMPAQIAKNEGLLIRQDWLDKLGLAVPKTIDELHEVLRQFTFNDPDGNGKDDTYGYGGFVEVTTYEAYPGRRFEPIMGAFGVEGTWDMRKDSFGLRIHKPEFYDFMVFMRQIIEEGLVDPNWMAYKKDDYRAAWKQGKFGVFREQNAAYAAQNNFTPFDKNFPDGYFTIMDPITGPTGLASIGPYASGLRLRAISKRAQEQGKAEKIIEFLEWSGHGEGYYLCFFGTEGVQYKFDENGIPVSLPGDLGFNGPVGQTYIQLRSLATTNATEAELLSRYPVWTRQKGKQMSAYWALREMQSKKWTSALGSELLPVASTDVKTFYEQGLAEFLAGKKPLTKENWDAFIKQLDKVGAAEWEAKGYEYAKANNLLQ